ncbi:MAG TPA: MFS transporter [bacterium]
MDLHRRTFAALRHRNFRLFWIAQLISLTGTWMHAVAQGWLVLELTDQPFWLGAVGAAGTLPVLAFSLLGGVAADRLPKRALLIASQSASATLALFLGLLALSGQVQVWHVLIVALALGTANALDLPARQSFIVEMVGREDLLNAIALNSFTFNAARVVGPAVAGVIVAAAGAPACFLVNAASFIPVVAALGMMRDLPGARQARPGSVATDLREGLAYVLRERRFQGFIGLVAMGSFFGFPCITLLPAFARDVLHAGAHGYGLLMAMTGVGAVVSALALAGRQRSGVSGGVVVWAGVAFGAALVVFAAARSFAVAAPLLVIAGAAMVAQAATANTLVQAMVPDVLRGRIMSVFTLVLMGAMPLGNIVIGALAELIGTTAAIAAFGLGLCAAVGAIAAVRREVF